MDSMCQKCWSKSYFETLPLVHAGKLLPVTNCYLWQTVTCDKMLPVTNCVSELYDWKNRRSLCMYLHMFHRHHCCSDYKAFLVQFLTQTPCISNVLRVFAVLPAHAGAFPKNGPRQFSVTPSLLYLQSQRTLYNVFRWTRAFKKRKKQAVKQTREAVYE
jgi:hypothetical protein